jgi:hypothetical protein
MFATTTRSSASPDGSESADTRLAAVRQRDAPTVGRGGVLVCWIVSGSWQQVGHHATHHVVYASDWAVQGLGVFVDDIVVSTGEGTTSFETGMDGWDVPAIRRARPAAGMPRRAARTAVATTAASGKPAAVVRVKSLPLGELPSGAPVAGRLTGDAFEPEAHVDRAFGCGIGASRKATAETNLQGAPDRSPVRACSVRQVTG